MKRVFEFLCAVALLAMNALGAEVNVYAAANTTYAFPELIKEFNKLHPDAKINLTLGASGGLVTQIQNSAPADIFMIWALRKRPTTQALQWLHQKFTHKALWRSFLLEMSILKKA